MPEIMAQDGQPQVWSKMKTPGAYPGGFDYQEKIT